MGLNIKSDEVHRLARLVACRTGASMTQAIEVALREKLDRLERERDRHHRIERLRAMLDELGPPPPGLTSDHADLWDEDGPPA